MLEFDRPFDLPTQPVAKRCPRLVTAVLIVMVVWLASPPMASAQESGEPTVSTTITVSEEPGVCPNQGPLCERLLDWTGNETFAETTAWILGTPLKIATVLALAVLLNRLVRRSIRKVAERVERFEHSVAGIDLPNALSSRQGAQRSQQRADAVSALLRSSATALIFGVAGIVILDMLGVSVVPILASLGVAGIAIGFGAQKLIEDLISGVMLIVEDQLGVGDRVDVGVAEGDVERVTLRSTVILARNGVRHYVPNSEIRQVANESQHKSRASVRIGVAGDADLRAAVTTFRQATEVLAAEDPWHDAGVEDVRLPFVAELGESAIVLEQRLFIEPTRRRPFERALRLRFVEAATAAGIELPNSQLDVHVKGEAAAA